MKLTRIAIEGFRSIADLPELGIGAPTLLTGHNDAGKSSILDAIRFLLNDYALLERDRTYVANQEEGLEENQSGRRVPQSWVEGVFALSEVEQTELGLGDRCEVASSAWW
ncbi:AAA family ATPase [Cryobacterium psychrophilum]|uniref:DUF2813 domain-containing protein n=1 Tax=Cryobacterium psychrophilum TaxID=41988 RepID=A0A4Y8KHW0_9MICO|nr:AAA family ATPase [Cryobacterium psychrophilum]TDW29194.1 AAA ATPase-like protein [Cryobacterium psychrophilum]TFD74643.1 DUF2813 domain-containing protein [Cryobacterium psychrophilum]